ncbi:hypothetical protein HYN48_08215 [Flavobacterium magnum]|uniref:YdhG-like domain-containing protein n=1 Tax=Flavobacterium magnum TaxID=2162713 RepID=A0A2S0REK0_9FLAO|nr:DUF1801 domain-containing protein [Flavobacterium magnum]AWA30064.1 hypothetical protein HYN48_08215 [Flavobacterium magnum]
MSKSAYDHDPQSVTEFIRNLHPDFAALTEAIRTAVLETDTLVSEHIKWNSPAFFYNGDMKPFDPKEYKRDILVIHTRKNYALLVFPTGNIIDDRDGVLEGNYADGRRMIRLGSIADLNKNRIALQNVIKDWLAKVEQ